MTATLTTRLRLEPLDPKHVEDLLSLRADERVHRWFEGPISRQEALSSLSEARLRWREDGIGSWSAYSLADGSYVGQGGASWSDAVGYRAVEVGWSLVPDHWGNGYATEMGAAGLTLAFSSSDVDQVVALALPDNERSVAVMRRLCLSYKGECRYRDKTHVVYSISRDEWQAGPGTEAPRSGEQPRTT